MSKHTLKEKRPVGYQALIARFGLSVIENWHQSSIACTASQVVDENKGIVQEFYTECYWPGASLGDQLEFALKYDGTNLGILFSIFQVAPQEEFLNYVSSKPRGKYARRLWFLYEFLTGTKLPLDDLKQGCYIDLIETEQYFTTATPRQSSRHKINNNLLGVKEFCPMVRRTKVLDALEKIDFTKQCQKLVEAYSPEILKRALSYLYTKETKSSFEIEHIQIDANRSDRFIALLELAEKEDFCKTESLIEIQNRILDQRFSTAGYRETQNYVGETIPWKQEKIHYISPKPGDLEELMAGLTSAHQVLDKDSIHAVIQATLISYGFVFLHPFDDGNGRIHRFLIHNILARKNFTPEKIMFPVSATMLKKQDEYDASLEDFSVPLMQHIDYQLGEDGSLSVSNETKHLYAYIDMTKQCEALFKFIQHTIEVELVEELSFLEKYSRSKKAVQNIVDMPDRLIDLFIRLCVQNNNQVSRKKRDSHFSMLTDEEIKEMGKVIQDIYGEQA